MDEPEVSGKPEVGKPEDFKHELELDGKPLAESDLEEFKINPNNSTFAYNYDEDENISVASGSESRTTLKSLEMKIQDVKKLADKLLEDPTISIDMGEQNSDSDVDLRLTASETDMINKKFQLLEEIAKLQNTSEQIKKSIIKMPKSIAGQGMVEVEKIEKKVELGKSITNIPELMTSIQNDINDIASNSQADLKGNPWSPIFKRVRFESARLKNSQRITARQRRPQVQDPLFSDLAPVYGTPNKPRNYIEINKIVRRRTMKTTPSIKSSKVRMLEEEAEKLRQKARVNYKFSKQSVKETDNSLELTSNTGSTTTSQADLGQKNEIVEEKKVDPKDEKTKSNDNENNEPSPVLSVVSVNKEMAVKESKIDVEIDEEMAVRGVAFLKNDESKGSIQGPNKKLSQILALRRKTSLIPRPVSAVNRSFTAPLGSVEMKKITSKIEQKSRMEFIEVEKDEGLSRKGDFWTIKMKNQVLKNQGKIHVLSPKSQSNAELSRPKKVRVNTAGSKKKAANSDIDNEPKLKFTIPMPINAYVHIKHHNLKSFLHNHYQFHRPMSENLNKIPMTKSTLLRINRYQSREMDPIPPPGTSTARAINYIEKVYGKNNPLSGWKNGYKKGSTSLNSMEKAKNPSKK